MRLRRPSIWLAAVLVLVLVTSSTSSTIIPNTVIVIGGTSISGGTDTGILYQNGTTVGQDPTHFVYSQSTGLFGVGTNNPGLYLDGTHGASFEGTGDNHATSVTVTGFRVSSNAVNFTLNHARGTQASPVALNAGDLVGELYGQAWTTTLNNFNEIGAEVFQYEGTAGGHDFGKIYWTLHDDEEPVFNLQQRQVGVSGSPNRVLAQAAFQQNFSSIDPICTNTGLDSGTYWLDSTIATDHVFRVCLPIANVPNWQKIVTQTPAGLATIPTLNLSTQLALTGNVTLPTLFAKITQAATAPGAGNCTMRWEVGTNAGTGKLVGYCGTSSTGVTIVDNVGAGF